MTRTITLLSFAFAMLLSVGAQATVKQATLRLTAPSGLYGETQFSFDNGYATTFGAEDQAFSTNGDEGVPILWSLSSNNTWCNSNGWSDLSSAATIAIGNDVDFDGTCTFSLSNIQNFDETQLVLLHDNGTGATVNLRSANYTCNMGSADSYLGRFTISFTLPANFSTQVAGCQNNDGAIGVSLDPSVTWSSVELFDASQNQAGNFNNVNGDIAFANLPQGAYEVRMHYGTYDVLRNFNVAGQAVTVSMSAATTTITEGETVSFISTTTNATNNSWDFGDGTMLSDVSEPSHTYTAPGQFTAIFTATNTYGCSAQSSTTITVEEIEEPVDTNTTTAINPIAKSVSMTAFAHNSRLTIRLPHALKQAATLEVYNLLGAQIGNYKLSVGTTSFNTFLETSALQTLIVQLTEGDITTTRKVAMQ